VDIASGVLDEEDAVAAIIRRELMEFLTQKLPPIDQIMAFDPNSVNEVFRKAGRSSAYNAASVARFPLHQ